MNVSMAKYNKDGSKIKIQHIRPGDISAQKRTIKSPSFRDNRKYSDVLVGKQKTALNEDCSSKIIPICFTLHAIENEVNVKMLGRAVIAENSKVIHLKNTEAKLSELLTSKKGIFSLSPTKILIVFDSVDDAVNAVSENSVLYSVFDDVRLWEEGESFDDRLIWIECFGIHPRCWSMENVRKIGEKWGPVLSIENKVDDICSLTYAKILVRTKAQNKVEARIRLLYANGSCDVWIKECVGYKEGQTREDRVCSTETLDAGTRRISLAESASPPAIDPVLGSLLNTVVDSNEFLWIDPIVVDEGATWQTVQTQNLQTCSQPIVVRTEKDTCALSQAKTPRGRPKKKINQKHVSPIPSLSDSNEALNTWHTAKLLGISSSDEGAVISALRKSKRLLIMDDKSK